MTWIATYGSGEDHLRQYPKEVKWINQCLKCNSKGYKPELPADTHFNSLRGRFNCLPLNEDGLCEVCEYNDWSFGEMASR